MKTNHDMELAKRIRQIRIDNHLTQDQVAKALNATPGYICNVESGRTAMSLRMLVYFAKLTGESLDSLVGSIEKDYAPTALDHEILEFMAKLTDDEKKKLLKTLKVWKN